MKLIVLHVPEAWMPLIDRARKELPRNYWIRDAIRDALKEEGVWPKEEIERKV